MLSTTLKSTLLGLCFAGLTIASGIASATTVSTVSAITFVDGTQNFGTNFTADNKGLLFSDGYSFSLASGTDLNSLTSSISSSAAVGLTITGFTLTSSTGYYTAGTQLSTGVVDMWTLVTNGLSAGAYTLTVSGLINSAQSASYSGNLNISSAVSAVPEPATYGMLLGGLGLIGMMARRRKTVSQSAMGALAV